ncbi:MAG: hypothetical protein ACKVRP_03360 [Bacteroidota bacterium]
MAWTDDYLIPPIESEWPSLKLLKKLIKDFAVLVPHSLMPHKKPKNPSKDLPKLTPDENTKKLCEKIYESSLSRIDSVEKKALGLLSFVTALSALLFFTYAQLSGLQGTGWLWVSMGCLLLTLIISFRCLSVKGIEHIFVNNIYDFDSTPASSSTELYVDYLSAAIFNEARADNTADMLRAARMTLALSIFLFVITLFSVVTFGDKVDTLSSTKLQQDQVEVLRGIQAAMQALDIKPASLIAVNARVDSLAASIDKFMYIVNSHEVKPEVKTDSAAKRIPSEIKTPMQRQN